MVTEIFDMTDNEDPDLQTITERATNQQLQFDATEWDARPSGRDASDESSHCHVCLTLDWESSSSRCVCVFHLPTQLLCAVCLLHQLHPNLTTQPADQSDAHCSNS